jgi:Ca2+:H+ antiporter
MPSLTSKHFYVDDEVTGSTRYPEGVTNVREKIRMSDRLHFRRNKKTDEESSPNSTIGSTVAPASTEGAAHPREEEEEEEEEEVPQMNVVTTVVSASPSLVHPYPL